MTDGPWTKYRAAAQPAGGTVNLPQVNVGTDPAPAPQQAAPADAPWLKYQRQAAPSSPSPSPMASPAPTSTPPAQSFPDVSTIPDPDGAMAFASATSAAPSGGMPAWMQTADDIVRLAANGMTLGYADKIAGYMNGTSADQERARSRDAADRTGKAGTLAEVGGAIATPLGMAGRGLTMAGRLGTRAMQGVTGTAARTGLAAAEGAGYGAVNATGHDENIQNGAGIGAVAGTLGHAAASAIGAGVRRVAGMFNSRPAIPAMDELRQAAGAAYDAADQAGVAYTPQLLNRLNSTVVQSLTDIGYDPALQPGVAVVVRRLADMQGGNVTLRGLDTLRKVASNGFIPGNASNNRAITQIIGAIDGVVQNPANGDVLMGNAQAGADALRQARELWARMAKAETVSETAEGAAMRAASTGSGANIDNATRQSMRGLYNSPASRGFTPDEDEVLRQIIMGSPGQNALRLVGKMAPTGIVSAGMGSGMGANIGSAIAGPIGGSVGMAVPSLVGGLAKAGADRMTAARTQELINIIMAGGNRQAAYGTPNAVQRGVDAYGDALAPVIMGWGVNRADHGLNRPAR